MENGILQQNLTTKQNLLYEINIYTRHIFEGTSLIINRFIV